MACILNIETSTRVCSVAISLNGALLFERCDKEGPSHATILGPFVSDALAFLRNKGRVLDAVAVSCGPGSYTGLRIGVSMAKGLCFAHNVPLIAIETTKIMAALVVDNGLADSSALLCPMIDARRMEVYAALYNKELEKVRDTQADIVDADTYASYLAANRVLFFGDGAEKCREAIVGDNAVFISGIDPLASAMCCLSDEAFSRKQFENTAYFEPFYLKEFVATKSKNKVLNQQ